MANAVHSGSLPNSDALRNRFSQAMSDMYKAEVPAYGDLLSIVAEVDNEVSTEPLQARHRIERHGAIRLGTAHELHTIARLFALFNMHPVGYYDLSVVGFPLHATAFRPWSSAALSKNPFRVFTSLLRLDLLPPHTRDMAQQALSNRDLFSNQLLELIQQAESHGSLSPQEEDELLSESLGVFKWHATASVPFEAYNKLNEVHPMVADIASFPSAHINHLTPRTLDIDKVQKTMGARGLKCKDRIEGPPRRKCAILLRQTSFRALEERVMFQDDNGQPILGFHTARFGEVEQRGAAVTPQGRRLYDQLLAETNTATATGDDTESTYQAAIHQTFQAFPDTWSELRAQKLVFFRYSRTGLNQDVTESGGAQSLSQLIGDGLISYEPIVYEDFLPVSAAGIFTSNIARTSNTGIQQGKGNPALLTRILGKGIPDPADLYARTEEESIEECRKALNLDCITVD